MSKALMCDLYELQMSYIYFLNGKKDEIATFDIFYRTNPDNGGFVLYCGLESIIDYILNFHFDDEDIKYLRSLNYYNEDFLSYLKNLRFTGNLYSMKEGSVCFPQEPVLKVEAPIIEAQLLETFILLKFNHESLIATKTARIIKSSRGIPVVEFGARRAHNEDAAVIGARSAYIGGALGTSLVESARIYGYNSYGTMAHSFVQSFPSEYEAFVAFAKSFPHSTSLLIDTYDTLNKGLPNAIRVFKEVLEPMGIYSGSVRIDSGDLSYLSKETRRILDLNGLSYIKIMVTNSLDEYSIDEILSNSSPIDSIGVGERLITSKDSPILDGVYKLSHIGSRDVLKLSSSPVKTTNPGSKKVYRVYSLSGKAEADLVCLNEEEFDNSKDLTLYDPLVTYKKKTFEAYKYNIKPLLLKVITNGVLSYEMPKLDEIKEYAKEEIESLWDEVKRFNNPHEYYVDLSDSLYDLKKKLIAKELAKDCE